MSRIYALRRLLEHGPMGRAELVLVTGWGSEVVDAALKCCLRRRVVRSVRRAAGSGFQRYVAVGCVL